VRAIVTFYIIVIHTSLENQNLHCTHIPADLVKMIPVINFLKQIFMIINFPIDILKEIL